MKNNDDLSHYKDKDISSIFLENQNNNMLLNIKISLLNKTSKKYNIKN